MRRRGGWPAQCAAITGNLRRLKRQHREDETRCCCARTGQSHGRTAMLRSARVHAELPHRSSISFLSCVRFATSFKTLKSIALKSSGFLGDPPIPSLLNCQRGVASPPVTLCLTRAKACQPHL